MLIVSENELKLKDSYECTLSVTKPEDFFQDQVYRFDILEKNNFRMDEVPIYMT